jgi:hypothetical protein
VLLTPQKSSGCPLNPSICPVIFVQWIKGSCVSLGINQWVFQKVAYVRVVSCTSAVLFAVCSFGGLHDYVCAKNCGVRLPPED